LERDFTRHYDFSEKQSGVNFTRQSFFKRVTPENLLGTHDISSTTATFSSLAWRYFKGWSFNQSSICHYTCL